MFLQNLNNINRLCRQSLSVARRAVVALVAEWGAFATGGVNERTWGQMETGGTEEKAWGDLET